MYSEKPRLHERQKSFRPGSLRTVSIDVTPRCNMQCPHCYAETFRHVAPVGLGDLRRAFDEFYGLGAYHYVLQGGEPVTDWERLEAILGMCRPDESYINVVSNGWEMTREAIRRLKRLKADKIAFSLDSGIEAEHDAGRMPGSFRRVLEAIDVVLSEGLLTSISTVVTHTSLYSEGFRQAYALAERKQIRIDVQIAEPVGKWDGRTEHLMTPDDSKFIKQLQLAAPLLPNGQRLVNRDIYSGDRDHCPAGVEFVAVSADGAFLPCNFLQYSLGNIRDKSIAAMRKALLTSKWFQGDVGCCLCGEHPEFIAAYVRPYACAPKPLDARAVFDLPEVCDAGI